MKSLLFTTLFFSFCVCAFAQSQQITQPQLSSDLQVIDNLDSVFFDLPNTVISGDTIDIPVSIKSDDIINALDFWLKFNHDKLKYETVIAHATYLQTLANYVITDSSIHFTSNSFTTYENDPVKLVSIRFTVIAQPVTAADFNSINALLNGDPVTPKMKDASIFTVGVNNVNVENGFTVYPNPANDIVTIESNGNSMCQLFDISGREIMNASLNNGTPDMLNVSSLANGIYTVHVTSGLSTKAIKLVVNHH